MATLTAWQCSRRTDAGRDSHWPSPAGDSGPGRRGPGRNEIQDRVGGGHFPVVNSLSRSGRCLAELPAAGTDQVTRGPQEDMRGARGFKDLELVGQAVGERAPDLTFDDGPDRFTVAADESYAPEILPPGGIVLDVEEDRPHAIHRGPELPLGLEVILLRHPDYSMKRWPSVF